MPPENYLPSKIDVSLGKAPLSAVIDGDICNVTLSEECSICSDCFYLWRRKKNHLLLSLCTYNIVYTKLQGSYMENAYIMRINI